MWKLYAWYTAGLRLQKLYNLEYYTKSFPCYPEEVKWKIYKFKLQLG